MKKTIQEIVVFEEQKPWKIFENNACLFFRLKKVWRTQHQPQNKEQEEGRRQSLL
jgi:hypothetical protein